MIHFFIPGPPKGKGRPRFGNGRAYTDKATREYEEYIRQCFYLRDTRGELGTEREISADIQCGIDINAYFSIPKSFSKKQRKNIVSKSIRPTKKPDADNIIKVVLDALNGVAWVDDKQVVRACCDKCYTPPSKFEGLSVYIAYGDEV